MNEAIFNLIGQAVAAETDNKVYARKQMRLGDFIAALEAIPKNEKGESKRVYFDVLDLLPTGFDSYRGYYDHLAIGFKDIDGWGPPVETVIEWAKAAIGSTFEGWKGGDFTMHEKTPLWMANPGNCTDYAVMGVEDNGWKVIIKTMKTED